MTKCKQSIHGNDCIFVFHRNRPRTMRSLFPGFVRKFHAAMKIKIISGNVDRLWISWTIEKWIFYNFQITAIRLNFFKVSRFWHLLHNIIFFCEDNLILFCEQNKQKTKLYSFSFCKKLKTFCSCQNFLSTSIVSFRVYLVIYLIFNFWSWKKNCSGIFHHAVRTFSSSFFISVLCIFNRFSAHVPYSNVEARKSYKWKEVNDRIFVGNDVEMTFPQRMNAPILGCIWIITACRSLLDICKNFCFW